MAHSLRFALTLLGSMALVFPALAGDGATPQADRARAPAAVKIGVVDLALVFKQYVKSAELEKRINDERDRLRGDLDEQKKSITNLVKELDLLDPTSETYMLKEDEKDAAVARFDRTKKRLEETIKKRWEEYNSQLLDDIELVVRAYGEEQGFTLIFKVDGKSSEESRMLAGLKSVLYYAKELDITPAVVELLNRRYEMVRAAGQGGGGARPAEKAGGGAPGATPGASKVAPGKP